MEQKIITEIHIEGKEVLHFSNLIIRQYFNRHHEFELHVDHDTFELSGSYRADRSRELAGFSKVYHAYKAKQADIEAGRDKAFYTYTSTGSTMGIAVTSTVYTIRPYEDAVVTAYTKLFDAELAAHSGPVAWGLDTRVLDRAPGKSVFDMIREKGAGIFYRKANKNAKLLINPAQIH